MSSVGGDARAAVRALLEARADGATVCPSEVARALVEAAGGADWRGEMPAVHAAVDRLVAEGGAADGERCGIDGAGGGVSDRAGGGTKPAG